MTSRSFAYPNSDVYKSKGAWFICDVCSQRFRRTDMLTRWDNLRVDAKCNDPRPPQMSIPDVYPEGIPFPDARSPQDRPDRLEDDTSLASMQGGMQAPFGVLYPPGGQNGQPGALSPLPVLESVGGVLTNTLLGTEAGDTVVTESQQGIIVEGVGTPIGVNVLADDVTFITGPIPAPQNSNSTVPDPVPAPQPPVGG